MKPSYSNFEPAFSEIDHLMAIYPGERHGISSVQGSTSVAAALADLSVSDLPARSSTPFSGPGYLGAVVEAYHGQQRPRLLIARNGSGGLRGVLLLVARPLTRCGLTLQEVGFPSNPNVIINDPLLRPPDATQAASALLDAAFANDCDSLMLDHLPVEGGQAEVFSCAAVERGAAADPPRASRSLFFATIGGDYDTFLASRSRNHRWQIKKTWRKATESGTLHVSVARGANDIRARLGTWFDIEARSWQAQTPDAAMQDVDRTFHTLLLERLPPEEVGCLWTVALDGKPVAALRMLESPTRTAVHTMHFDAEYRNLAPGLIAFDAMVRDACERGISEVDMHGNTEFFARWSTGARPHQSIRLYRPGVKGLMFQKLRQSTVALKNYQKRRVSGG